MRRSRRRHLEDTFRGSVFAGPAGAGLALLLSAATVALERRMPVPPDPLFSEGVATALLTAVVGGMPTPTGSYFALLPLVVQLAGSQLTPRLLRWFYHAWLRQFAVSTFMFTFAYALVQLAAVRSGSGVANATPSGWRARGNAVARWRRAPWTAGGDLG